MALSNLHAGLHGHRAPIAIRKQRAKRAGLHARSESEFVPSSRLAWRSALGSPPQAMRTSAQVQSQEPVLVLGTTVTVTGPRGVLPGTWPG